MSPADLVGDADRLAALESFDILDTPPEAGYDDVVQIARLVCEAPVALVSLVAADRQWFKARAGFELCETDLQSSVCAHALAEPDLLVISDLSKDERTRRNPLVTGEPGIRFYAGAPLRASSGHVIGSLCVIDGAPREGLTHQQAETLRMLARQVVRQLELRRALIERDDLIAGRGQADRRRTALLHLGDRLRDLSSEADMVAAALEIVGRTLAATRTGYGYLDATSECVEIRDWTDGAASIAGRHRFADYGDLLPDVLAGRPIIIEDVRTDPRTASDPEPMLDLEIGSLVNIPIRERGRTVALFIVQDRTPRPWPEEVLAFLRNVADRIEAAVGRLRAESEQHVLNNELSHRMKNMMAMVQAIATQTLKGVPDRRPIDALMARILALSTAHDVLLAQSWDGAPLGSIADSVLQNFGTRTSLSGPDVHLGPRATLSLSMLLHELATNATKYGAMSVDHGTVAIDWRVEGDELVLNWRERGGPPATKPDGKGFGSRLIRMGLVGTGGSEVRYLQTGIEAEFRAPLDQVRQS